MTQLEGVQRRTTKLITAIKDEIYEDRLRLVNLTTIGNEETIEVI